MKHNIVKWLLPIGVTASLMVGCASINRQGPIGTVNPRGVTASTATITGPVQSTTSTATAPNTMSVIQYDNSASPELSLHEAEMRSTIFQAEDCLIVEAGDKPGTFIASGSERDLDRLRSYLQHCPDYVNDVPARATCGFNVHGRPLYRSPGRLVFQLDSQGVAENQRAFNMKNGPKWLLIPHHNVQARNGIIIEYSAPNKDNKERWSAHFTYIADLPPGSYVPKNAAPAQGGQSCGAPKQPIEVRKSEPTPRQTPAAKPREEPPIQQENLDKPKGDGDGSQGAPPGTAGPAPTKLPDDGQQSDVLCTIYYDFDQDVLRPESKSVLDKAVEYLRQHKEVKIEIEGHCDERGTLEYNMALGERRAKSAKQYLVDMGIDPRRIDTLSFGEEDPADPGHNEEAWAKNRRAEFNVAK